MCLLSAGYGLLFVCLLHEIYCLLFVDCVMLAINCFIIFIYCYWLLITDCCTIYYCNLLLVVAGFVFVGMCLQRFVRCLMFVVCLFTVYLLPCVMFCFVCFVCCNKYEMTLNCICVVCCVLFVWLLLFIIWCLLFMCVVCWLLCDVCLL